MTGPGVKALLLLVLCASITVALQSWVGDATIYSQELAERRAQMHEALLANAPPEGKTWREIGAGSHNIRIGTIYLAEFLRSVSGLSIGQTYKLIDTVCLFGILIGTFLYLRRWVPDSYALIGVLYLAAILPMTYFQHYFQPWDRFQVLLWLPLLAFIRDGRFWPTAGVLALTMFVKFDAVLTPGLYFLARIDRGNWLRTSAESIGLCIIGFGIYFGLSAALPAPAEPPRFGLSWLLQQMPMNVEAFATLNLRHPILLGLGLPTLLALLWLRRADRFLVASFILAAGMSLIWFLFTVYAELRAQIPALLLVLPAALLALQRVLDGDASEAERAR